VLRSYRQIKEYEKGIFELKENGLTNREIEEKFGFGLGQVKDLIKRRDENQQKLAAGIALKRKGRLQKYYVVIKYRVIYRHQDKF